MRDKKTVKRISTGVKVDEKEVSPKTKKIKNFEKAQIVEKLKMELMGKMTALGPEYHYNESVDATKIASKIVSKQQAESIEFFGFAEMWMARRESKSMRNYVCMLHKLQEFLKRDTLDFSEITYTLLKDFENYLSDFTRAKSMYLGEIRHLYREAMLEYNTDEETVIKNDPFLRYKTPKQVLKLGVRSLKLEDILKIYHYDAAPGSRVQMARDCFILSFCLMGMNSVDMYLATKLNNNINRGLKEIGKAIGIPNLQFWITVLRQILRPQDESHHRTLFVHGILPHFLVGERKRTQFVQHLLHRLQNPRLQMVYAVFAVGFVAVLRNSSQSFNCSMVMWRGLFCPLMAM